MYRYVCTGIQVRYTGTEVQVRKYTYTSKRYRYAIQVQMYRYVCTGRTNSTHKNWSQQYTQKLVTKVHTFWRPKVHTDLETKNTQLFATGKYKTRKSIDEYRRQK